MPACSGVRGRDTGCSACGLCQGARLRPAVLGFAALTNAVGMMTKLHLRHEAHGLRHQLLLAL